MSLINTLVNIGLSAKEAKIYLTLLEVKEALPSSISKISGVKRPTTYLILEQLTKKGLASKVRKGKADFYQPVNPNSLVEEQHKLFSDLEESLPEMLQMHERFAVRPQVSFFEGQKGLIQIMEDTLTTSTELLCWANIEIATTSCLEDYYPTYIKKKVERNLWLRGIFTESETAYKFKKNGKNELREICIISAEDYPFTNEINIYDDKIAIISHEDEIGVIIRNENIAKMQRSIFNFAFKYAKLVKK
jgi:HTH-type transcriptional regulator, sugar sensing transcriptional regulator